MGHVSYGVSYGVRDSDDKISRFTTHVGVIATLLVAASTRAKWEH